MERRMVQFCRRLAGRVRIGAAEWLMERREIPRGVSKAAGFSVFLAVSTLAFLGGVLLLATFMHVVITKFDVPQNLPYPVYSVPGAGVSHSGSSGGSHGTRIGESPSPGQSKPSIGQGEGGQGAGGQGAGGQGVGGQGAGGQGAGSSRIVVIRRPTVSRALDQWLSSRPDPAARYLESDAVDLGLLLQREIHRILLQVLGDATRTPPPIERPLGVPLTNGQ